MVTNCTVSENTITSSTNGIILGMSGEENGEDGNSIVDNSITATAYGIALVYACDTLIEGNTVSTSLYDGIALENLNKFTEVEGDKIFGSVQNTISENCVTAAQDGLFIGFNCDNNAITNNEFEATESAAHLWRGGNQTITGNTLTGAEIGLRLKGSSDNTIQNNTITGNDVGLNTGGTLDYGPSEDNLIIQNRIYGNSVYGAQTLEGSPLDLTRNYWGSQYGPEHASNPFTGTDGIGNAVSDNVAFMPFYATATTTPETEFVVLEKDDGSKAVYEVFTSDDLAGVLDIAVEGDEVLLADNTFVGNFIVPAGVNLAAQTDAIPVIQGAGAAALTITGGDVNISGLVIQADGDNPAVLVTVNDASDPVTVVNSSVLAVTGYAFYNGTGIPAIIESNYWALEDPTPVIENGADDSPETVLEDPPANLTAMLYVYAPKSLIKGEELQNYQVRIFNAEDLRAFAVKIKVPKADFAAPANICLGEAFDLAGDLLLVDDDDYDAATHYIYEITSTRLDQTGTSGANLELFSFDLTSNNVSNLDGSLVEILDIVLYGLGNPPAIIDCEGTMSKAVIIDADDPDWTPIADLGTLLIDHAASTMAFPKVVQTYLNLAFADNYKLDAISYLIQTAGDEPAYDAFGTEIATAVNALAWQDAAWQVPDNILNAAANNLPTGDYTIWFLFEDKAGNYEVEGVDFSIDRSAPDPITWADGSLACRTTIDSNGSIDLNWTNPAGAEHNHIWFCNYSDLTGAGDYPVYNPAGFELPALAAAPNPYDWSTQSNWQYRGYIDANGTYTLINLPRGYYYFVVFVEDAAGNFSAASSVKESISYWPGDVDANSAVDAADIFALSAVWGTTVTDGHICNVGPTVDRTRRGLPTPDDRINIEDLMIFAMNYDNTDYEVYDRTGEETTPIRIEMISETIDNNLVVSLLLNDNDSFVKGLNIPVLYGNGLSLQSVELGSIWPEGSVMFYNDEAGIAEISMTTLGAEALIPGNGVIATLTYSIDGSAVITELQHMIARDISNREIEIVNNPTGSVDNHEEVIVIPATNFLGSAYPNPFNPSTTISYGLTEAQNVKITVFNSRGQAVRTLVNTMMPAGTHTMVWDGRDNNNRSVSSGLYFFRMESRNHTEIKKAILMK